MYRSYRVIVQGKQGQSFVMASSAKEASEIAAKAVHDGDTVVVEDPNGVEMSCEALAEIIRANEVPEDL